MNVTLTGESSDTRSMTSGELWNLGSETTGMFSLSRGLAEEVVVGVMVVSPKVLSGLSRILLKEDVFPLVDDCFLSWFTKHKEHEQPVTKFAIPFLT